ncbi:MAG: serine hydrolase, partial [Bdellovibrionales bacterium]|nr:serine hydrolase [Bdellovibrionales bacterium]
KIRQAITKNEIILKKEGEAFSYGPIHLQIAMAMAEKTSGKSWQVLVKNELIRPLGLGKEIFYSHLPGKKSKSGNPSGFDGLSISMKDYLKIMKALVDGKESYLSEKMVDIMLSDQAQSETVLEASPMKVLLRKDYRFGFGNWIECDPGGEKACMERNIRSCPGSFGWYPFIDIKNGYYGILAALEGQDLEKRSSEPTLRSWRVLNKVGSFLQEWQL